MKKYEMMEVQLMEMAEQQTECLGKQAIIEQEAAQLPPIPEAQFEEME